MRGAVRLLKPGGTLVYSTCSLEPEENDQVVKIVLAENPWLLQQTQRELTPFAEGADGAFICKIQRS